MKRPEMTSRIVAPTLTLLLAMSAAPIAQAADPWATLSDAAVDEPLVAQKRLEALLLEQPSFYPAHFNLGTLLMESDRERAATHFEHATSSPSPELAHDAWYNLALVRWGQGRIDDALMAAGKAVEIAGNSPETVKLRDELRRVAIYRANEARKKAEAEAKKLRLASSELPEAHVGEAYDARVQAAGGAGGYKFALGLPPAPPTTTPLKAPAPGTAPAKPPAPPAPPTPPPGLSLEADGRLHGIPTRDGRFPLALVLSDQKNDNVNGTVMLVVHPAPAITTTTLPEAILGSPYEAVIDSVGLDQPTWTVSGLPPGLVASTEAGTSLRLSGTPTQAMKAMLTVRADDGKRHAQCGGKESGAQPAIPLVVSDSFAPDLAVLPPATAWAPYTHQLGVRGRPQQYKFSSPGAGGVKLDAKGLVSGTPEQAGELTLPLTISAEDNRTRTSSVRLPVNPPPVIEEPQPLQFTVGQPAQRPLTVTGGTPPYTWEIAEGVLPKGLRLDPDGTIRGAASEAGETDVTLALSDRWKARTQHPVHVVVEKSKDQPQDQKDQQQAKQDQQDQQQQQQQGKDQQQAGKDQKDQQQQAGKDQKDQQQQQQGKDQQQQAGKDQQQAGKDQQQASKDQQQAGKDQQQAASERTAQQAQVLNQAAADRWLESLPKEDRDVLMYQLLEGGDLKPRRKEKTW